MNTIIPYVDNIPQFVLDNYNNSLNVDGVISRARFERLASKQVLDWMTDNKVSYKILFAYIGKGHTKIFPTFCKVCGKELSLNAFKNNARYCNAKCSQKDPAVIALRTKNIQEKYGEGVINVSQRLQAPNYKEVKYLPEKTITIPDEIYNKIQSTYRIESNMFLGMDCQFWFRDNNIPIPVVRRFVEKGLHAIKPVYCPNCGKQLTNHQIVAKSEYCSLKCCCAKYYCSDTTNEYLDHNVNIPKIFMEFEHKSFKERLQKVNAGEFMKLMCENGYRNWLIDNGVTLALVTKTLKENKLVIEPQYCKQCRNLLTIKSMGFGLTFCSRKCACNNEDRNNKSKQTNLKRYGVEHYTHTAEYRYNDRLERYDNWTKKLLDKNIISLDPKDQYLTKEDHFHFECKTCGNQWYQDDIQHSHIWCSNCRGTPYSAEESKLQDYIQSICDKDILFNDRKLLNKKELDVLIPELKLAFEFDGNYFHCSRFARIFPEYHKWKTEQCLDKNIKLIHIYEYEWNSNRNNLKRWINKIINKALVKINSTETTIKQISYTEYHNFIDNNNVEKLQYSDKWYSLFYRDKIISVAGVFNSTIVNVTDSLDCIVENSIDKFMTYLSMDCLIDASKMTIDLSKYQYTWNRPNFAMIQRNKLIYDVDIHINDIYWLCDAGTIALKKPS